MPANTTLTQADENNVHSQNGEDGVLHRLFAALDIATGTAVEFGAWDGVHLSNTAALRARGWNTILIEADETKIARLRALESGRTKVVHAFVEPRGEHSLDAILDGIGVTHVDFVSIDIDGDDLNVFRHLVRRPTVVCIEFNPGIPPPYSFTNPERQHKGSSIAAIYEVAQDKGYELVYATYCNAFLVRKPEASRFAHYDATRAFHLTRRPAVMFMFDGEFRLVGEGTSPVFRHPASTIPVYVPRLPRFLLGWPPTRWQVTTAYLYCAITAPLFYVWHLCREFVKQMRRIGS